MGWANGLIGACLCVHVCKSVLSAYYSLEPVRNKKRNEEERRQWEKKGGLEGETDKQKSFGEVWGRGGAQMGKCSGAVAKRSWR